MPVTAGDASESHLFVDGAGRLHAVYPRLDVAGNHLHQGATIRKGTELRRWLVTMHGPSNANITLKCGPGAKHVGLGQQEGAKISFGVSKGSDYYRRTIRVHFYPRPGVDANGAKASVYALCKTS